MIRKKTLRELFIWKLLTSRKFKGEERLHHPIYETCQSARNWAIVAFDDWDESDEEKEEKIKEFSKLLTTEQFRIKKLNHLDT